MKSINAKKSAKTANVQAKPVGAAQSEAGVRIVKTAQCPSLSGKSKLTYEVGATSSNDLRLRITANTNAGAFCTDWTELKAVRAALDRAPRNETVTSDVLVPLFREKSANMPGFLWSLLLNEGLLRRSTKAKETRRYERVEPETFDAAVKALLEGKGAVVDAKATKAKGKKAVAAKPKNDKKSSRPS